jgi:LSD1 subclass zinc finger protein
MARKKGNAAEAVDEFDYVEHDNSRSKMPVVFVNQPIDRKLAILAKGAKEIRCIICKKIAPLSDAESSDDGFICGNCLKIRQ